MHVICIKSLCPRNFIIVCVSHDPISGQIPFISQVWFKVRKVRGNCVWLLYFVEAYTLTHAKICISRHFIVLHITHSNVVWYIRHHIYTILLYYSIHIGISTWNIILLLFRNTKYNILVQRAHYYCLIKVVHEN